MPEPSDIRDTAVKESAKMAPQRLLAALGLIIAIAACQVTPNPGEKTPPTVTITLMDKIGNQTAFSPPSTVNGKFVFSGNLDLVTVDPNLDIVITISATDPGGMKTLAGGISYYANCSGGGVSIPPNLSTSVTEDMHTVGGVIPSPH